MTASDAEALFFAGDFEGALASRALSKNDEAAALTLIGALEAANGLYKRLDVSHPFDLVHLGLLRYLESRVDEAYRLFSLTSINHEQTLLSTDKPQSGYIYPPRWDINFWHQFAKEFATHLEGSGVWSKMYSTRSTLHTFLEQQNQNLRALNSNKRPPLANVYIDPTTSYGNSKRGFSIAVLNDSEIWQLSTLGVELDYDIVISPSHGCLIELRKITKNTVISNPIFTALSRLHNQEPRTELRHYDNYLARMEKRETDILFTGSVGNPIYKSKAELLYKLSGLRCGINFLVIDRALPQHHYHAALRSTKFTISPIRYTGSLNTRAIQGLMEGAFALVEKGSAFSYYGLGPNQGVFEYHENKVEKDVENALECWADIYPKLQQSELRDRVSILIPQSPHLEDIWQKICSWLALTVQKRRAGGLSGEKTKVLNCWTFDRGAAPAFPELVKLGADHLISNLNQVEYINIFFALIDKKEFKLAREVMDGSLNALSSAATINLLSVLSRFLAGDINRADRQLKDIAENLNSLQGHEYLKLLFGSHQLNTWLMKYALDPLEYLKRSARPQSGTKVDPKIPMGTYLIINTMLGFRRLARKEISIHEELAAQDISRQTTQQKHLSNLLRLEGSLVTNDSLGPQDVSAIHECITKFPWYFQEYIYYAGKNTEFDKIFFKGKAHERYLKFITRIISDRPHASTVNFTGATRIYLLEKFGECEHRAVCQLIEKTYRLPKRYAWILAEKLVEPVKKDGGQLTKEIYNFFNPRSLFDT